MTMIRPPCITILNILTPFRSFTPNVVKLLTFFENICDNNERYSYDLTSQNVTQKPLDPHC